MTDRIFNRAYHPPTEEYVYWLADNYDPTGVEYPGTPPFAETIDRVIVDKPEFPDQGTGVGVLVNDSAPESFLAPGVGDNAYQDYSSEATARLDIQSMLLPFPTIRTSSGETLLDIEYFT